MPSWVGQYFDTKVVFRDEVITDSAKLSEQAALFERAILKHLKDEMLRKGIDAPIVLYGSPSAGCLYDQVWVYVNAGVPAIGILALSNLFPAIEHAARCLWRDNISELVARAGPIQEDPSVIGHASPPSGPYQTFTWLPSSEHRHGSDGAVRDADDQSTRQSQTPPPSTPDAPPKLSPAALVSRAPKFSTRDWVFSILAALAFIGYINERQRDERKLNEITERLSRIEALGAAPPQPAPIQVQCPAAPHITVSCPDLRGTTRTVRTYSTRPR